MGKARSRNYPAIDLGEALGRARELYKQEGRARAPASVVVSAWGYKSLNGASLRVLSALRQYGLLDGGNTDTRLTDRALALVLEPEDSPMYAQALTEALSTPSLFQEIMQEYGANLPSDGALNSYLVRRQNFTEGAARTLIQSFRASVDLVRTQTALYNTVDSTHNAPMNVVAAEPPMSVPSLVLTAGPSDRTLDFKSGNIVANVLIKTGAAAKEDVEFFSHWLDLAKLRLLSAVTVSPPPQNEMSMGKAENQTGQA